MALRSDGRKLSFEILSQSSSLVEDEALLYRSDSDPVQRHIAESKTTEKPKCKKRRHRKGSKRKKTIESAITEDTIAERMVDPDSVFNHSESTNTFAGSGDAFSILGNGDRDFTNCRNELESKCMSYTVVCEETRVAEESGGSVCTVTEVTEPEVQKVRGEGFNFGELRQRSVSGTGDDAAASRVEDNESEKGVEVSSAAKQRGEPNGSVVANTLETAESLDWKRLMAEDPNRESNRSLVNALYMTSKLLFDIHSFFVVVFLAISWVFGGDIAIQVLHGRNAQRQFITEHHNSG